MNLEIKETRSSTIQSLCRLIRDYQMTNNVVVASFDSDSLKEFRRLCPQVATSAGASEARLFFGLQKAYLEGAYSPDAQVLQVPETLGDLRIVNKRFIDAAHARNMRVQVWSVNDVDAMQTAFGTGCGRHHDGLSAALGAIIRKAVNRRRVMFNVCLTIFLSCS